MNIIANIKTIRSQFLVPVLLGLLLSGCATHNRDMSKVADQLRAKMPVESALTKIQELETEDSNKAHYLLNVGYLQLITANYQNAIISLEQAKQTMNEVEAISISESAAAVTINDTMSSYSGWPTDRVLVHGMLAIAYLLSEDLNGARVEILQADVQMRKLADSDKTEGQLAFVRYLAGVIYELNQEYDSALVSYRMTFNILQARNEPIPKSLQQSLVDLTKKVGLNDESKRYQKKFNLELSTANVKKQYIISFDGVVTQMMQHRSSLWWSDDQVYLSVALPTFSRDSSITQTVYVQSNSRDIPTQPIEYIEKRAREDLKAKMPTIAATSLARAAVKYQTVKALNEVDPLAGALANLATELTEIADTRHWGMLPSSIQIATCYSVQPTLNISTKFGTQVVNISESQNTIILLSSLTKNVHLANY